MFQGKGKWFSVSVLALCVSEDEWTAVNATHIFLYM